MLSQRLYAQHDDFDFLCDFFLTEDIAFLPELRGRSLQAPDRGVHVLYAALVFRHQRTVKQLVQGRE